MSFLGYQTPEEMLQKVGSPQKCLELIDAELERIRSKN